MNEIFSKKIILLLAGLGLALGLIVSYIQIEMLVGLVLLVIFGILAFTNLLTAFIVYLVWLSVEGVFKRGFPSILVYAVRDAGIALLFVGWLFVYRRTGKKISEIPFASLILIFALIVILQIFNPLNNQPLFARLTGARRLLLAVPAYFIGYGLITNKETLKKIIKWVVLLSAIVSIVGIAGFFLRFSEMPIGVGTLFQQGHRLHEWDATLFKLSSTLSDATSLSLSFAIVLLLAIALLINSKRTRDKIAYAISIPIIGFATFLSDVRGGWANFGMGIVLFAFMKDSKTVIKLVVIGSIVLLLLSTTPLFWRIASLATPTTDLSMLGRYQKSLEILNYPEAILVGRGVQGVGGGLIEGLNADFPGTELFYVGLVYQLGIAGLVVFLYLMISIIRQGINNIRNEKDPELNNIGKMILAHQIATLIGLITSAWSFYWMPIALYNWFFLGVLIKLPSLSKDREVKKEK